MKALIIGAAGFVGNYLIDHIAKDLPWSLSVTKLKNESIENNQVEQFDLDIMDKEAIVAVIDKVQPDYIFHLAAQSSVALSWKNPTLTVDINIKGSIHVLDAVRESKCQPRILLIGSGEEYGHILPAESPISESNHMRPGNIYAATKVCQNMIGKIYADAYQMDIIMIRAFNHIGPKQSPLFVVADFCKQVTEIEKGLREPLIKVGNLSARRDFTDVRDVVRAYTDLIQRGTAGETYNVGSGKAIAISDILDLTLSCAKVKIKCEVDPEKLRPVDVPLIEADISKLQECTGWERKIELKDTIEETLEYWRAMI